MASVVFGAVIGEARGSVGNVTYSRNQFGAYSKARVTPTNPNTAKQQTSRARLRACVIQWQSLTNAQRARYQIIAEMYNNKNRVGQSFKYNGYIYFMRQALLSVNSAKPQPTQGEAPQQKSTTSIVSIVALNTAFVVTFNTPTISSNQFVSISITPYRPASRISFNKSLLKNIFFDNASVGNVSENLTGVINANIGALSANIGKLVTIGLKSYNTNTGESYQTVYQTAQIT